MCWEVSLWWEGVDEIRGFNVVGGVNVVGLGQ